MKQIQIQNKPLDIAALQAELWTGNPAVGAVVSFVGLMRDMNEGEPAESMLLEHYPGMTERALEQIVAEAGERWPVLAVRVVHRVGELRPLDAIVMVAVAAAHRGEAFQACEFIIDYLKTRAPFWKKERTAAGERWVEARTSDAEAERRWEKG
jgi:molybdopterin synthase catalytic subunit